jgi:hypothetical protein
VVEAAAGGHRPLHVLRAMMADWSVLAPPFQMLSPSM